MTANQWEHLNPDSEIGVDGIAKRTDAQGFVLTKPIFNEIPARKRKALSAGPLKPDRRADFGIRVKRSPLQPLAGSIIFGAFSLGGNPGGSLFGQLEF